MQRRHAVNELLAFVICAAGLIMPALSLRAQDAQIPLPLTFNEVAKGDVNVIIRGSEIFVQPADLEKAGRTAPFSVFENAGQDCCARSRLLVETAAKEELLEHYATATRAIVVGDPESTETQMGPLVSAGQRDTVEEYIERGIEEGAAVLTGGVRPNGLDRGFYLLPTILDGCTNDMVVAQEEIFGPVVSVITFETEDEAVRLANDTPYGLSGSLWTRDGARQLRVARALRTGAIGVNSNSSVFPQAPFGGYKQSGVGKELGMEALVHNTELKSVFLSTER